MSNTTGGSFGGSLMSQGGQKSFDMEIESDVIQLLKTIHQKPLQQTVKNHLRDLIFEYRQSRLPGDLEKIKQNFAPLDIAIAVSQEQAPNAPLTTDKKPPLRTLGSARPQPRFAPVANTQERTVPVQEVVQQEIPEVVMPKQWPEPEKEPQAPVTPPAQVDDIESLQPKAAPAGNHLERIKEIKRLVNEKVGNPVNLIESHNEVGREYMSALLDAMKKSGGGATGEIEKAMERLEKAFTEVQSAVGEGNGSVAHEERKMPEAPVQNPSPDKVKVPVKSSISSEEREVPEARERMSSRVDTPIRKAPLSVSGSASVDAVPQMNSVKARIDEVTVPAQAVSAPLAHSTPATTKEPTNLGIHSVAKEKQLQDLLRSTRQKDSEAKKQEAHEREAALDPLTTTEVTSGLDQLLSEWNLFKNSGIFGTGPSGKDHPLYKKLSALTMAAVIAGRFEGSNAQIKQSITDYMNGWRYEEGIIHEHGETFEHYLRRVVRHILNKQKSK